MRLHRLLRAVLVVLAAGWLAGCASNPYQYREASYVAPSAPGPDQTLVYVLRENSFVGGGRKFAIVADDTVMAVLTPGAYGYFTLPSEQHQIVALISRSPMMNFPLDKRPGSTVYLYCRVGYTSGIFMEEIQEAQARQLMSEFRYTVIDNPGQKAHRDFREYYRQLYAPKK
jgi:hypothetical protein